MGPALRRLFFGLGVFLGVVAPQVAPELTARPYREAAEVFVNAEVAGAFGETALELAQAGNRVALRVEARAGSSPGTVAMGYLRRDAASGAWAVLAPGGDGAERRLQSREAALVLATRVWGLRAGPLSALGGGGSVRVRASVGILDESGAWHDAAILWGYAAPELRFDYADAEEVPY